MKNLNLKLSLALSLLCFTRTFARQPININQEITGIVKDSSNDKAVNYNFMLDEKLTIELKTGLHLLRQLAGFADRVTDGYLDPKTSAVSKEENWIKENREDMSIEKMQKFIEENFGLESAKNFKQKIQNNIKCVAKLGNRLIDKKTQNPDNPNNDAAF